MIPVNQIGRYRTCFHRMLNERVKPYIRKTKKQQEVLHPRKHYIVMIEGRIWLIWYSNYKKEGSVIGEISYPQKMGKTAYTAKEWDGIVAEYIPIAERVIEGME